MHYIADYGLFLAKAITWVIALLIVVAGTAALILKNKSESSARLKIKKINRKYEKMEEILREKILPKKAFKTFLKEKSKKEKSEEKEIRKKLYVMNFCGDIRASHVDNLREEITAILNVATSKDEVVVCLESAGGIVHGYGLCASQLQRITAKQIPLTVIIDKVAASGGYMMACVADQILAAPFAIVGSIGVIAQLPNFHRLLKKHDIDFEQITAGEYKRTLTLLGENTEKAREKLKEEIEEIHHHFKEFISFNRPQIDIAKVATGEHWLALKALELKLIDGLTTSDDYLFSKHKVADIYAVHYLRKKSISEKVSHFMEEKSGLYSKHYQYLMKGDGMLE